LTCFFDFLSLKKFSTSQADIEDYFRTNKENGGTAANVSTVVNILSGPKTTHNDAILKNLLDLTWKSSMDLCGWMSKSKSRAGGPLNAAGKLLERIEKAMSQGSSSSFLQKGSSFLQPVPFPKLPCGGSSFLQPIPGVKGPCGL